MVDEEDEHRADHGADESRRLPRRVNPHRLAEERREDRADDTEQRGDDYFGPALNKVARVMSAGHGGQILLLRATYELVRDHPPADVTLKEKRPLVLCVRETPLNKIHIRNMYRAADAGATIFPLIPAFYYGPASLDEMAREFAYRVLAHLGLPQAQAFRWKG